MDDNILQDLACEARKEIIPRFSRAKNVDNKWVYLAQLGHREFQEVEVIICRHPEHKCVNGVVHQIIHPILNPRIPNFFHEIERFSPITSVPQKRIPRAVVIHYCAWYPFLRNRLDVN